MDQFFSQASYYTNRTISDFFKNLLRYSQHKVNHRCCWHWWHMEKLFNQKNCHYFFWTHLGSRFSIQIHFSFKLILSFQQSDTVPIVCHRCRLHWWQIWCRCCWYWWKVATGHHCHWWQISAGIIDTGGKLPPVSLTPVATLPPISTTPAKLIAKFAAGVVDTVVHLDLRISPRIFKQIPNSPNKILWGWGRLTHEKNQMQKICDTVPITGWHTYFMSLECWSSVWQACYTVLLATWFL